MKPWKRTRVAHDARSICRGMAALALAASATTAGAAVAAGTASQAPPTPPPAAITAAVTTALTPAIAETERSAAQGDWRAQETLGLVYVTSALAQTGHAAPATWQPLAQQGLAWLTLAAEQGSPAARQALAALYAQGQIVTRDERAAARWRSAGTLEDAGCR